VSNFKVYYHHLVLKDDIPSLDNKIRKNIQKAINSRLLTQPEKYAKPLRYTLKGLWSLRVGDWRIIFKIKGSEIWIMAIGHRREVYEKTVREIDNSEIS
jgi:mRNA interferase RelE/StbE